MQASGRVQENDAHTCVLWWKITGWSEGREQRDKAAVQQPGLVCLGAVCPQGLAVSTAARVGTGGDQPTAGNTPPVPGLGGAAAAHSSQIPGKTSLLRGAFWFF